MCAAKNCSDGTSLASNARTRNVLPSYLPQIGQTPPPPTTHTTPGSTTTPSALALFQVKYSHIPRRNSSCPITFQILPRCAFFSTTPLYSHNFSGFFALLHQLFIVALPTQINCVGFSTFFKHHRRKLPISDRFFTAAIVTQKMDPRGSLKALCTKAGASASS